MGPVLAAVSTAYRLVSGLNTFDNDKYTRAAKLIAFTSKDAQQRKHDGRLYGSTKSGDYPEIRCRMGEATRELSKGCTEFRHGKLLSRLLVHSQTSPWTSWRSVSGHLAGVRTSGGTGSCRTSYRILLCQPFCPGDRTTGRAVCRRLPTFVDG